LELCDVVWCCVFFFEAKRVQVFLAVQVFLGSSMGGGCKIRQIILDPTNLGFF
jgi:hypothetical protein